MVDALDPYNLSRFFEAQEEDYEQALEEIKRGRKATHWMCTLPERWLWLAPTPRPSMERAWQSASEGQ